MWLGDIETSRGIRVCYYRVLKKAVAIACKVYPAAKKGFVRYP